MSEIIIPSNLPVAENNFSGLQHQSSFKKWAGLGVLTLGLAIVVIDTSLLNVSLATIIKDLNTDLQSLQWVITAYALVLAAFTITGGRLGDLYGRRKMFMLGAIIFATGSFIASISHSIPVLLFGEAIVEGFGAALMMPATASLVVANFKGKDRATAFGVWGAAAGASSAIGPLLGGYLTSHYSWRWGFRINIFVGIIVVLGSLFLIKESLDERKPKLDWWGVLLSSVGLLAIVFGIIESSTLGWWHAKKAFEFFGHSLAFSNFSLVPVSILFGFVMLAIFAWWELRLEKRGQTPLVSMKLLRNQQFTSGAITTAILTLGMTGMVFALPVFLQTVKNLGAFDTGLALLPLSLALLIVAPLSGILSKKITPKYIIMAGLLIDVAAAFVIRSNISVDMPISRLIFGLTIYGIGMGLVFPPISNLVLSAVPVEMAGEGSGVNNTLRQVGATLGAAIIGAAILTSVSAHLVKGIEASQIIPNAAKAQIISVVSDPDSNVEFSSGKSLPGVGSGLIGDEMKALVNGASAMATRDAYVYSALFAFLCFITALFLPKTDVHVDGAAPEMSHGFGKFALAGLLLVLGISTAYLLLRQSANQVLASGLKPSIINMANFNISQNSFAPSFASVAESGDASATPVNSVAALTPASIASTTPDYPASTTPLVVEKIYTDNALGFSVKVNQEWQATKAPSGFEVVFVNAQEQTVDVQAYKSNGDSLDVVLSQLNGSPSVSDIFRTSFLGEPAISFKTDSSQAIAVIHNNKLYYLMAPSLNLGLVKSFAFLP